MSVSKALKLLLLVAICATASAAGELDYAGMNRSVVPGDDFFQFANGAWLASSDIPADKGSYGASEIVEERTEIQLAAMVQKASQTTAPAGSDLQLIGDYYAAFMDQDGIEARGLRPLDTLRMEIQSISDRHELSRYLGETLRADVDVLNATNVVTDNLFGLWIAQDFDHPDRYVPFLLQGGLGMPDRSYYLDAAPKAAAIKAKYAAHVAAMLTLTGLSRPAERAQRVLDLEQRIASVHATREATGDLLKGNNRWRRADFRKNAPGIDWELFFNAARLPLGQRDLMVWQPGAVTGIAALVESEPLATWKNYLLFHAIEHRAQYLPKAVVDEHFAFFGSTLNGKEEQETRWKRAVESTNNALSDAVGRLYVARNFPAGSKARIETMVEHIRSAFSRRIERLEWMAPATKASAQARLAALQIGVGYPEQWRDYAGLKIVRDDAYGNAERADWFEYGHQLAKLGHAVDRSEWDISPQTVNSINLPAMNAINFAAAMLQPPYFYPEGDPAVNYGAIGATLGHEISHSFDDQGAMFDAGNRLRSWWTEADLAHFRAAGELLVAQYNKYQPLPDLAVNGRLTLSENIADLVGLLVALDAYHQEVQGHSADIVDGYTGDQRFFIAYAQSCREKSRPLELRRDLLEDEHAPYEYRAKTVRNSDDWYAAFAVKPGQQLYLAPADRVRIW